jgi:class 3 adenylate cyclase/HAMP domain-containing protein
VTRTTSLGTRLIVATGLLVVAIVGAMVVVWATSARELVQDATRRRAIAFTRLVSSAYQDEFDDEDWTQIDDNLALAIKNDDAFAYAFMFDARRHDAIVATTMNDLRGAYVPDVVRTDLARAADGAAETYLLRDVDFEGQRRGTRGDRIIDVVLPIVLSSGRKIGRLEIGVSLARAAAAERAAVEKALAVGAAALAVGLIGAFFLGRGVARRVQRLKESAEKIAEGDLDHRARVDDPPDEVAALADAFNRMSTALKGSFGRLEKTLESFLRFVPKEFLGVIAHQGIENIEVGTGEARTVSILFSDIRGYTTLSERLSPAEVFHDLNEYLAAMGVAIDKEGGFVDKYIGDAIMAIFDDESTDAVLRAALGMRRELGALNARRAAEGKPPIENGVGIHRGAVVMGTVGTANRINCTVIGDAVNLASRVVTDTVVAAIGDRSLFSLDLADAAASVKGKNTQVTLYSLVPPRPVAAPDAHGT